MTTSEIAGLAVIVFAGFGLAVVALMWPLLRRAAPPTDDEPVIVRSPLKRRRRRGRR